MSAILSQPQCVKELSIQNYYATPTTLLISLLARLPDLIANYQTSVFLINFGNTINK